MESLTDEFLQGAVVRDEKGRTIISIQDLIPNPIYDSNLFNFDFFTSNSLSELQIKGKLNISPSEPTETQHDSDLQEG